MSERTRIQRKKNHDGERDLAPPIVHEALLGHAAGGIHIDHTAPAPQLQPKLIVNQPGDIYEQEADRVADMVVNGSRALIGSFTAIPSVQRDTAGAPPPQTSGQLPPDAEFPLTDSGLSAGKAQAEALEAISEAIQETPAGQELTRKAAELGADLWSHLEGKVVVIVSGAAALGALLAANGELPVSIPSIPLDWAVPGLKANLTYEGPLRDPSKVMLTLTLSFGGAVTDAGPTSRPTNDAQADEIRRFQQSIHYAPGTPEAREELARKAAYEQWLLSRLPSPGHFGDLTTLGFSSSNERQGANPAADQTNPFQLTPPTFGEDLGKSRFPRLAPELSLDEPLIMRKAPGSAEGMDAPPVVQEVLQSSGHTLDDTTRAYMEPRFGQHFGHVRVHTDPTAARSAESVSALAYTVGNDVVFGAGQYQPGTDAGKRLIAHELTHVVQQDSSNVTQVQRAGSNEASGRTEDSARTRTGAVAPVFFGIETATRRIYASVRVPGFPITEIAEYIYGSFEVVAALQRLNGVPDIVPPGINLSLIDRQLSSTAQQEIQNGLENGTILRTEGLSSGISASSTTEIYRFSAMGQTYELTEGQMRGLLQGLAIWIQRKAKYYLGMSENGRGTHSDHLEHTNSIVRGISDWFADQDELPLSVWDRSFGLSQDIIATLDGTNFDSGDLRNLSLVMGHQAQQLVEAATALDDAEQGWHSYIEGTIGGAEVAVHRLELVRNASFGLLAGFAGAAVAPVVAVAVGSELAAIGVTGTAATIASSSAAIGAGAVTGGAVRGTLNVITPGMQTEQPGIRRLVSGFQQGALDGGLGAAGRLATPVVESVIGQRLLSGSSGAGAQTAVRVMAGTGIGASSSAISTAIRCADELARGDISPAQYLVVIGWESLKGAIFGAVFAFLTSGGQSSSGNRIVSASSEGSPGGGFTEPDFVLTPPQVKPGTGVISQMAFHRPTGQYFEATYDPLTNTGQVVNMSTGQPVGVFVNGQLSPVASGMLPATGTQAASNQQISAGLVLSQESATAPVSERPLLPSMTEPGGATLSSNLMTEAERNVSAFELMKSRYAPTDASGVVRPTAEPNEEAVLSFTSTKMYLVRAGALNETTNGRFGNGMLYGDVQTAQAAARYFASLGQEGIRQEGAILPEWNLIEAVFIYEVPPNHPSIHSVAAQQISQSGQLYSGGGTQVQIDAVGLNRVGNPIEVTEP